MNAFETWVGNGDGADVGFDGAEWVVFTGDASGC